MKNVYRLNINNRAFNAIYEKKKKIEIRANKKGRVDYSQLSKDDYIIFKNANTSSNLLCRVLRTKWYQSARALLEAEGTEYSLSSTNSIDDGVLAIESIPHYKELIAANGVFAIAVEPLSNLFM